MTDDEILDALEWQFNEPARPIRLNINAVKVQEMVKQQSEFADAVHVEVNRMRPWWRKVPYERVAAMVGGVQRVRELMTFNPSHPEHLDAAVQESGLRGRGLTDLAWKVSTTILAIEEWRSRSTPR